ncbi:phosphatidylserine decarboxylase family protein, partial [Flavobacterium sp. LBUM151]
MFHKEGGPSILLGTVFAVAVLLIADKFIDIAWLRMLVQIAGVVVLIIILQFFRNPKRIAIKNSDHILAPVDGKVVVIEE